MWSSVFVFSPNMLGTVNCLGLDGQSPHMRQRLGTSLYAGLLFTVLGVTAWATGQPFVFPSLGPSAFMLAFERTSGRGRRYRIVVSHLIGGVAGFVAYAALASGIAITETTPAFSAEGLRLAASATVSVVATSWGMIATDTVHAPACATTLIVSLGLLSTPLQVGIIVASVVVLVEFHAAVLVGYRRVVGESHPAYSEDG